MKTFFNLVQEVQKPGLCSRCGGCATFCTAINYGALEINKDGKPVYQDMEKCIECGLCYSICPEINDLDEETKRQAAWSEPMGRVIETTVIRATDEKIREKASDGGAVTALLLHLFDRNRIDGAIVTRPTGKFQRQPFLATSPREILDSEGFSMDISHGMQHFSEEYVTFSTIEKFDSMMKKGLKRVALVGTPCQIKSLRKMQVLHLVPSETIKFCFGLFCSGNFTSGDKEMRQYACSYCSDFSNEFADISFGGIGAREGWTTVITRTPLGRAVLADTRNLGRIEQFSVQDNSEFASQALQNVRTASAEKKKAARYNRRNLKAKSVQVRI